MIKQYILILSNLLFIMSCNPWTLEPITEVVCLKMSEHYSDSIGTVLIKKEIFYDDNNNPISEQYFELTNNNYQLLGETLTQYDDSNNPIKIEHYENGSLAYSCIKEWNAQGKILLQENFDENGLILQRSSYLYDQNGYLIELSVLSPNNFIRIHTFENNAVGDIIKRTIMDGNNNDILEIVRYIYNAQGQLIREDHLSPNEELFYYLIHEHNGQGDRSRYARYNADEMLEFEYKYQRLYDEKGNVIDYSSYYNGALFLNREVYKYDEHNNLIERQSLNEVGEFQYKVVFNFECKEVKIH